MPHQMQQRGYYQGQGGPGGQGSQQARTPRWPGTQQVPRGASAYNQAMRPGGPRAQIQSAGQGPRPGVPPTSGPAGNRPMAGGAPTAPVSMGPRPPRGAPNANIRAAGGAQPQQMSYKFNPGIRNPPPQMAPQQNNLAGHGQVPTAPEASALHVQGQEPLTPSMLASADVQTQKQMLGERLYPSIYSMYPEQAGKITGMLLDIDNSEILHMLEHQESLRAKVEEALAVLQAHQAKEHAAKSEPS